MAVREINIKSGKEILAIKQICADQYWLYALCYNNSLWRYDWEIKKWQELPNIEREIEN